MVNDVNLGSILASCIKYFHVDYLMWWSDHLCEAQRSVVTSGKNPVTHDVTKSGDRSSDSISPTVTHWAAPVAQIQHCFMLRDGQSTESEKGFVLWSPFHEPLLWGLCFLRGTVSSSWHPQRSRSWALMERTGRVTPGEFKWNRQNLTFQSPTFPPPLGSAPTLGQK